MKKPLLIVALVALAIGTQAQHEGSAFTATGRAGVSTTFLTDYQAIGINPANLGWSSKYEGKTVTIGLLEGNYSVHSDALSKPEIKQDLLKFNSDDFTYDEKIAAAEAFAQAGLGANVNINWVGVAVTTEKAGGFGFAVKERFQWFSKMSKTVSDILFQGYNADYFDVGYYVDPNTLDTLLTSNPDSINYAEVSVPLPFNQILNGSEFNLQWVREYNLSYGVKLVSAAEGEDGEGGGLDLYGGVGIKYITGLGILDVRSEGGKLTAFSALTPRFDINYGPTATTGNPSSLESQDSGLPQGVGSGFGFDIGMTAIINNKLKLGLAITDIGSITWDGNVYSINDTLLINAENGGINSYDLVDQAEQLVGDGGFLSWDGLQEINVKLPTMIRGGASIVASDLIEVGLEVVMPANEEPGNFENAVFGVGGDIKPGPIRLSAGIVTGGNYDLNIPVGIAFVPLSGTWEAGIASRDAVTFFTRNGPTVSLSTGFLRFRF